MRVLLLQLDGKLPNIALMRIAAHCRPYADDIAYRNTYFPVDFGREAEVVDATNANLARDEPAAVRSAAISRFFADGPRLASEMATAACSVAVRFAVRLGMAPTVGEALTQLWERWDGAGFPVHISESAISTQGRSMNRTFAPISKPARIACHSGE